MSLVYFGRRLLNPYDTHTDVFEFVFRKESARGEEEGHQQFPGRSITLEKRRGEGGGDGERADPGVVN